MVHRIDWISGYLALALALTLGISACQTKVEFKEIAPRKAQLSDRNSLLISSDTPVEVEVTFYSYAHGQNERVDRTVQTPYLLDLGSALVEYDSLNMVSGRRVIKGIKRIRHIYSEGGAEYLHIRNRSEAPLSLAIIGRQPIRLTASGEVVEAHPLPIYRGVPLLYLLRPQETPVRTIPYNAVLEYSRDKGLVSIGRTAIRHLDLAPEKLAGIVGEHVPLSIDRARSIAPRSDTSSSTTRRGPSSE